MIVFCRRMGRGQNYGRVGAGHSSSRSSPLEDFITSITIIPSAQMKIKQMFKLTTRRSDERHGVFVSIPVLCVNNILPAGSPVFSIVQEGRLDEFMALLRDGGASIRDHDEYGASLLHVSGLVLTAQCHMVTSADGLPQVRSHGVTASYVSVSYRIRGRHGLCRALVWSGRLHRPRVR